jgi:hypothetical protein
VSRKREFAEKESEKHHPEAARGLGDPLGGREDNGILVGNEAVRFSLV